jgi:peptidoglycan/LPS O-acetylase OafA/YrhL
MERESTRRLEELDSIRGLAALTVVFSHFYNLWLDDAMRGSSALARHAFTYSVYPFVQGHSAVMLFFILSGFVLSIPAIHGRSQSYPVFVTRRVFRIYMPYLIALALSVAGDMFLHGQITRSPWFNGFWSEPVNWQLVTKHIEFVGQYDTSQFNPPIWSLICEMRISLIFPLLCAVALMLRPAQSLLLAFGVSFFSAYANDHLMPSVLHLPIYGTTHYAALFVVGIFLARKKDSIAEIFQRLSGGTKIAFGVFCALSYVYGSDAWLNGLHALGSDKWTLTADWPTAVGAAGLIVLAMNSASLHRILLWRPIHALGKMSYSVYLIHFIILLYLVHLFYGRVPLLAIILSCLVVSLAASWQFYQFVEKPFMSLGRTVSGYLAPSTRRPVAMAKKDEQATPQLK